MVNTTTLEEAKKMLRENFDTGIECPCCGQFVKKYNRKITSAMAYGLILLYQYNKKNPGEWVHVENYFKSLNIPSSIRGDISKLRYWHLIEKKSEIREDGSNRNGYYRIDNLNGISFVENRKRVSARAYIYNQRVYGFSPETVTIAECLGKKFNYKELMGYDKQ